MSVQEGRGARLTDPQKPAILHAMLSDMLGEILDNLMNASIYCTDCYKLVIEILKPGIMENVRVS